MSEETNNENRRKADDANSELRRLQKKLIPLNIVVAIISLIAAISIIVAPLISFDLGQIMSGVAQEITAESGDEYYDDEYYDEEGTESEKSSSDYLTAILGSFGEIKVNITTYGVAKFAFSKDPVGRITDSIVAEIKKIEKNLITNVAVVLIPQLIEENASEYNIATENIDVQAIIDNFDNIFEAKTEEEAKAAIHDLTVEIQKQAVTTDGEHLIPDEYLADIESLINEYYDSAVEALDGEELTFESFVCVTISNAMNGGEEGDEPATIYTSYKDLIGSIISVPDGFEDVENEAYEEIRFAVEIAVLSAKYFVFAMLFYVVVWFVQFLFAFLRIFRKNKRFMMWYTKLWGFTPCLIFGVAPLITGTILSSVLGIELVSVIFGAISSLTWISGGCYLALWIISIFWAFPIKRKIRKLLKEGATYD